MTEWQYQIEIADLIDKYEQDKDVKSFARTLSLRLIEFIDGAVRKPFIPEDEWEDYLGIIQLIATDLEIAEEIYEVDEALEKLYDLGDTSLDYKFGGKKLIWINTI